MQTENLRPSQRKTSKKVFIIILLGIAVALLFFLTFPDSFSTGQNEPPEKNEQTSFHLSDWQLDFERVLSERFMPLAWVRNEERFNRFSDPDQKEFTLRISFPTGYAIHPLIFSLMHISKSHGLHCIESFEKLSPGIVQVAFACPNGKLLQLRFEEHEGLEWYPVEIAVVIDDFGYKMDESVQQFLNIPFPITFAVIPGTEFAQQVANQAHKSGFDVLIHLPMEPLESRVEQNGFTIFTRMSEPEIDQVIARSIKAIPHAIGINNHMGSRATADRRTMARLMRSLKKYKLYFLDSVTNRNSVAFQLAVQSGIPALKMTTYLDNPKSSRTVKAKLEEVIKNSQPGKPAIVIGHARDETARTLTKEMIRWAFLGVKFIRLNKILEKQ